MFGNRLPEIAFTRGRCTSLLQRTFLFYHSFLIPLLELPRPVLLFFFSTEKSSRNYYTALSLLCTAIRGNNVKLISRAFYLNLLVFKRKALRIKLLSLLLLHVFRVVL